MADSAETADNANIRFAILANNMVTLINFNGFILRAVVLSDAVN